ncbi:hypothetical protein HDU99_007931, partial [Rhizoclosmatium hyalinum]
CDFKGHNMILNLLHFATLAFALGKLEPPAGKIIFGAWVDNSNAPVSGGDSPAAFNSRIGFNAG